MNWAEISPALLPTIFCQFAERAVLSTGTSRRADFSEHSTSVPPCGPEVYCCTSQKYFSSSLSGPWCPYSFHWIICLHPCGSPILYPILNFLWSCKHKFLIISYRFATARHWNENISDLTHFCHSIFCLISASPPFFSSLGHSICSHTPRVPLTSSILTPYSMPCPFPWPPTSQTVSFPHKICCLRLCLPIRWPLLDAWNVISATKDLNF